MGPKSFESKKEGPKCLATPRTPRAQPHALAFITIGRVISSLIKYGYSQLKRFLP